MSNAASNSIAQTFRRFWKLPNEDCTLSQVVGRVDLTFFRDGFGYVITNAFWVFKLWLIREEKRVFSKTLARQPADVPLSTSLEAKKAWTVFEIYFELFKMCIFRFWKLFRTVQHFCFSTGPSSGPNRHKKAVFRTTIKNQKSSATMNSNIWIWQLLHIPLHATPEGRQPHPRRNRSVPPHEATFKNEKHTF